LTDKKPLKQLELPHFFQILWLQYCDQWGESGSGRVDNHGIAYVLVQGDSIKIYLLSVFLLLEGQMRTKFGSNLAIQDEMACKLIS
jgi:hypothetical protein